MTEEESSTLILGLVVILVGLLGGIAAISSKALALMDENLIEV